MDTTTLIRRFLLKHPSDTLFTTRDVLRYGKRSAVDTCLWQMVCEGELIRVVRGIFVKAGSTRVFTNLELARVKVESFGRKLISHPNTYNTANPTTGLDDPNETEFGISGFSSSFMYGGVRIFLRALISRKAELQKSPIGQGINCLWRNETWESIDDSKRVWAVRRHWGTDKRIEFASLCGLMPWWILDHFIEWFGPACANIFRIDKPAPEPGPRPIPQAELDAARSREMEREPVYEDEYVPEEADAEEEEEEEEEECLQESPDDPLFDDLLGFKPG